jgi:hypothetical protein
MALLVDGAISTLDDVVEVDSGVVDVASAETINILQKLDLAQRDCEIKISHFVIQHGLEPRLGSFNNALRLDRIVVNDALKRWHGLHALYLFYSDAHYRTLNDRYSQKCAHFKALAAGLAGLHEQRCHASQTRFAAKYEIESTRFPSELVRIK